MSNKHIKEFSSVKKTESGIAIEIHSQNKDELQAVQGMVENCAQGKCDCMKPEVKEKVEGMEFKTLDGVSAIHIKGNISIAEIQETMDRSNMDKTGCCSTQAESCG